MVNNVRLWPSVTPSATNPRASNNTVGIEFEVSKDQRLFAIWYYSTPGTTDLPTKTVIWDAVAGTAVSGTVNTSPSWSGAVGSGWVFAAYDGSVTLTAGTKYIVSCYDSGTGIWQNRTAAYWTTGAGSAGISNGALSAPPNATAQIGQGVATGSDAFPSTTGAGQNYWVDVEVGDAPPGVSTSGSLSLSSLAMTGSVTIVLPPMPGTGSTGSAAPYAVSSEVAPSGTASTVLAAQAASSGAAPSGTASNSYNGSAGTGNAS